MVGEPRAAHHNTDKAMKREVKQALSRIRRAQDAVYNNKVSECRCMSVDCNSLEHEDGKVVTWWTIFCHKDSDPEKCRSWRVADDAPEDIDITLQQISEYIEHAV